MMYIRVDDEDDTMTGDSDIVTRFYIEISAVVGIEVTSTTENGENAVGRLGASYKVSCADNFYTPDCSVFCLARNDAQGHYTCDSQGNTVCLEGFEDPTSSCTQPCTSAEGCCEPIHCCWEYFHAFIASLSATAPISGYCNASGNCICQNSYSGDNCDIGKKNYDPHNQEPVLWCLEFPSTRLDLCIAVTIIA